ncbi:YcjX family protein [Litorilituus lipolyticus]|uniref:YcjX family protein n=1 Tax=Litorilituus lipolyticus TaxID=2491017 RepID=A0A502LA96_9GAMM|nr:YcjX family protein [Litorilituus lipolyticus]TPH19171.1 YcjX family protein [Litorilituus lipolyticus]
MALIKKQQLEKLKGKANDLFSRTIDQHINLAVTGLSRSGKTAFITSLVNQLVNEGANSHLNFFDPVHQGNFIAAKRVPQKHYHVPRFDYEGAISALSNETPTWPEPTQGISELRLAIRYQPKQSLLKYATDMATLTIDITDYPGEWLLDLPMLKQTFEQWSVKMLELLCSEPRLNHSKAFIEKVSKIDPFSVANEEVIAELAAEYTQLLHKFRYELGLSVIQPGRFILPAELAGAPILEFFPFANFNNIDGNDYQNAKDDSFIGMLRARYIEYKERVVKEFYQKHFSRFDRQIVLADCLTPLNNGEHSFADLEMAMSMILESYSYGRSGILSRLFAPKIDKLLFAATKADHVTPEQHQSLTDLLNQLIYQSKHQLNYEAIEMKSLAIASVKATKSGKTVHQGKEIPVIQGRKLKTNDELSPDVQVEERITIFPGAVPSNLPDKTYWQEKGFNFISFAPIDGIAKNQALPHVRMDQVLQFLLADKML